MVRKQNTGKHNVHNGSMIRNENVLLAPFLFLFGKVDKLIPEPHAVKHSVAPDTDKLIGVSIMFFIKRENINRDSDRNR